jgi:hypothetical protein
MADTKDQLALEDFTSQRYVAEATIAAGASVSDVVDLHGARLFGLWIGTDWVAGEVSLRVSRDGVTMFDVKELTRDATWARDITTSARGAFQPVPVAGLRNVRYVQVVSENAQTNGCTVGLDLGEI